MSKLYPNPNQFINCSHTLIFCPPAKNFFGDRPGDRFNTFTFFRVEVLIYFGRVCVSKLLGAKNQVNGKGPKHQRT